MAEKQIPPLGYEDQDPGVLEFVYENMQSGEAVYYHAFAAGLRPDQDLTVTQWADEHRVLPRKGSAEPGRYRSSRTPYMREIMDNMSPFSGVREQCTMKGTQLGFTAGGENWIGFVIDVAPGPMIMVLPTVELAKDFSKQKLAPTIEETPRLTGKVRDRRSRDSGNTIQAKEFPGGMLFLLGSNSGAGFRQRSVRYLFLDDVDGFEHDVGGEGDPADLVKKRTDTFSHRRKIWENSTPTVKGLSRIEKAFDESSQAYYQVPCPLCGEFQALEWGGKDAEFGLKFKRNKAGAVVDVWYECARCNGRIDERHKTGMLEHGRWIHTYPDRAKKGYHLSSLYSPIGWVSWRQVVEEFLDAKDNADRLKVWVNTRLGLPFDQAGDQPDWVMLKARCEPYEAWTMPEGGLALTAGVDVQNDRLAVIIRAWGRAEESWLVWWGELFGDPSGTEVWKQLDGLLTRSYSGRKIISMGVDSGGHKTQEVYHYARRRSPVVFALKGASQYGRPIISRPSKVDVTWSGETIRNGVELWPVGTDTAKATIYGRLRLEPPGPGCYHWPVGATDEYFRQLTAEKLTTKIVKGYPKQEWVKVGERNEALDCEVYSYAAAIRVGLDKIDWTNAEEGEQAPPARKPRGVISKGVKV